MSSFHAIETLYRGIHSVLSTLIILCGMVIGHSYLYTALVMVIGVGGLLYIYYLATLGWEEVALQRMR